MDNYSTKLKEEKKNFNSYIALRIEIGVWHEKIRLLPK